MPGVHLMSQRRHGAVKCVQKPVVSNIECGDARLEALRPGCSPSDGCTFLTHNFKDPHDHQHQRVTGADAQTARNEFFVIGEVSLAVTNDACQWQCRHLRSEFAFDNDADILVGNLNLPRVDAIGLVAKGSQHPRVTGASGLLR